MSNSNVNKPGHKQDGQRKDVEQTIELTDLDTKLDPKGGVSIPGVSGSQGSKGGGHCN